MKIVTETVEEFAAGKEITVIIPVLGRPQNAAQVSESIHAAATTPTRVLFVCSPGDDAQIAACRGCDADTMIVTWEPSFGDFAKKTNAGYRESDTPFIFAGADDLLFYSGWDQAAIDAIGELGVCGTNDNGNPMVIKGRHSTHSLISRAYIEDPGATFLDGPGVVYCEDYDHQQVDNELVTAAQMRGQWAFSDYPIVEHLHPFWPGADGQPKGQMDKTYEKALSGSRHDRDIYLQRYRSWRNGLRSGRTR
jgi:hypothetical protein